MSDLISRQAAIEALGNGALVNYQAAGHNNGLVKAIDVIKGLPSAHPEPMCVAKVTLTDEQVKEAFEKAKGEIVAVLDAQPERKKGKWIDEGFYADGHGAHAFRCSECGWHIIEYDPDPFCRWCGADMREEAQDATD